jgi:hypothetical protein
MKTNLIFAALCGTFLFASASAAYAAEAPYGGTAAAVPGTVMAENYDTGGQGVAYNVTSTNGTANAYRAQGVDLEAAKAPATGNNLGWSAAGQWFKYTVNVSTAGTYTVSFLVAAESAIGDAFHLSNSSGTNLSGSVAVPNTGAWQTWTTVKATVTLPAGTQTLTLNQDAGGWNIDSMAFALNGGGGCTTKPSAPTGLAASGTSSTGTTLTWTADTAPANCSISSYTVLKNGASIGTATSATFAVTGLAASTNYSFTVEASDAAGTSAASAVLSVTTPAATSGEGPYGGTAAAVPGTVMAENYDTGGQGVAYNVTAVNGTDNGYRSDGVDLEKATAPATGNNLGWTAAGQWFRYTVNVATAGAYTVSFLVAAPAAVADGFHLSNSSGTNLSGSVAVPDTGGWQTWTTVKATVTLPAGTQTLTLNDDGPGWNIDSMAFAAGSGGGSTVSHYEYVLLDQNLYVYDMDNNFQLLKHVSIPQVMGTRGMGAVISTNMLYISFGQYGGNNVSVPGSLLKYDLLTDTVVWTQSYSFGVDSFDISPDGSTLYMPDGENSGDGIWYLIDPVTGSVKGSINSGWIGPHDTVVSLDGTYVFLCPHQSRELVEASTSTDSVVLHVPLDLPEGPFTINGKHTLAFSTETGLFGFQVSNTTSGAVLFTVPIPGFSVPSGFSGETPDHGISLSPDEKELYLIDIANGYAHVFDVSGLPSIEPSLIANVPLTTSFTGSQSPCLYDCGREGWIRHTTDGNYVLVGDSGNVISTSTRQVVATLPQLYNTRVFVGIDWQNGLPISTSTRQGKGYVTQ